MSSTSPGKSASRICVPRHQQMGVPTLGNTPPILRRLRERIAFHDRDSLVRVGKHPCGEEPGHARVEVADPGHEQPVGGERRLAVTGEDDPGADVLESLDGIMFSGGGDIDPRVEQVILASAASRSASVAFARCTAFSRLLVIAARTASTLAVPRAT